MNERKKNQPHSVISGTGWLSAHNQTWGAFYVRVTDRLRLPYLLSVHSSVKFTKAPHFPSTVCVRCRNALLVILPSSLRKVSSAYFFLSHLKTLQNWRGKSMKNLRMCSVPGAQAWTCYGSFLNFTHFKRFVLFSHELVNECLLLLFFNVKFRCEGISVCGRQNTPSSFFSYFFQEPHNMVLNSSILRVYVPSCIVFCDLQRLN